MKPLRIIIAGFIIAAMNTLPASPLYSEAGAAESVYPVSASTSLSIKVAVLDSGSNTAYKEGISLIDSTPGDHNGHGTLMARIIEEVYPGAELYIVKVIGDNGLALNEKAVILGLEWAISRDVDIINISLRLKGSSELYQAIREAYRKGIVIVAAAGNRRT
ncbi:MAG TPA: hypothetical protein ENG75_06615, partial [Nitrospirae bacterium]|nr:hypothetical protein [Nitrospirota bacterium]